MLYENVALGATANVEEPVGLCNLQLAVVGNEGAGVDVYEWVCDGICDSDKDTSPVVPEPDTLPVGTTVVNVCENDFVPPVLTVPETTLRVQSLIDVSLVQPVRAVLCLNTVILDEGMSAIISSFVPKSHPRILY